jgi:hypothetical protein
MVLHPSVPLHRPGSRHALPGRESLKSSYLRLRVCRLGSRLHRLRQTCGRDQACCHLDLVLGGAPRRIGAINECGDVLESPGDSAEVVAEEMLDDYVGT